MKTVTLACLNCLITFDETDGGGPIYAECPVCEAAYGDGVLRTDSTAFLYAVDRKLRAEGKDMTKGDQLHFTQYEQPE